MAISFSAYDGTDTQPRLGTHGYVPSPRNSGGVKQSLALSGFQTLSAWVKAQVFVQMHHGRGLEGMVTKNSAYL